MAEKRRRPRIGDVLELAVGSGFAYLQFVGTHDKYGDAIRVAPKVSAAPRDIVDSLFDGA